MRLIKSLFTFLLVIALLLLGIWFTLRNQAQVPLDLLFIQLPDNSLALWLILSLITGALVGLLLLLPWLTGCKAHSMKLERQLKQQQKELHQLRTLSLKSPE
ncbi:lipopolysaccharide assembly protein LapA domain-containing protein [Marinospirillum sp.]|uniref:lipopolysaccharide assembly protein LapA domain-containing protein n=1 Tax=Marinospirillum sp. TaxID=2183934 RepID=UPI00286FD869|nr:lipopolysaccharide assembly protein LapA domain-containing protein [Marinospirillum sp.]MDR9467640.1 lipopolysaccharide assembly protein LapA domain-containing protein [Marinospirillum sp.]